MPLAQGRSSEDVSLKHLKTPQVDKLDADRKTRAIVEGMLANIRENREEAVCTYAKDLDGWTQDFALSDEKKAKLIAQVSDQTKEDIQFAHTQIKRFAKAQRESLKDFSSKPSLR
jgi:sulfopropanediol 3-dehydrogenase